MINKTGLSIFLFFSLNTLVIARNLSESDCITAINPDLNNDGIVSYKDFWQVGKSFGLSNQDKRYISGSDVNCDGQINVTDWDYISDSYGKSFEQRPEVHGYLLFTSQKKQLYVGQETSFRYSININATNKNHKAFTAKLIHSIKPSDGLMFKINRNQQQLITAKKTGYRSLNRKLSTTFIPQIPGTYTYKVKVVIPETGDVFERKVDFEVLAAKKMHIKLDILFNQNPHTPSFLSAKFRVSGTDINDINWMELIDEDTGIHYKISQAPWEKLVKLSKAFIKQEGCKKFYVIAYTDYGSKQSEVTRFCNEIPKKHSRYLENRNIKYMPSIRAAMEMNPDLQSLICSGKYIMFNLMNDINASKTLKRIKQLGAEIIWHDNVGFQRDLLTGYYYARFSNTQTIEGQLTVIQKLNELSEINQLVFFTNKQQNKQCKSVNSFKNITHDSGSAGFGSLEQFN